MPTARGSLACPVEIGAVEMSPRAGPVLPDPYRLPVAFAAHRRRRRDIAGRIRSPFPPSEVEASVRPAGRRAGRPQRSPGLRRPHPGAGSGTMLVNGTPSRDEPGPVPAGETAGVLLLEGDPWLGRHGRMTTSTEASPGLFNLSE